MKRLHYFILCSCLFLFCQCNSKKEKESISESKCINVDFGDLIKVKSSTISIKKFIRLETNANCLIQKIKQIEVFNDKIYLMDNICFYSFSLDGKFLNKIDHFGFWDKRTKKAMNFKYNQVEDDLGIGGKYPLPMGRYKNMLIGAILPFDVNMEMVRQPELKKLINGITDESNPVLVLYSVNLR